MKGWGMVSDHHSHSHQDGGKGGEGKDLPCARSILDPDTQWNLMTCV